MTNVAEHKLYKIICIDNQFLLHLHIQIYPLHSSMTCGVLEDKSDKTRVKANETLAQG